MGDCFYGSVVGIERGRISARDGALYRVQSYTRDGVVTRWIEALQGEYERDQDVYFFMFDDGRGMILGRVIN